MSTLRYSRWRWDTLLIRCSRRTRYSRRSVVAFSLHWCSGCWFSVDEPSVDVCRQTYRRKKTWRRCLTARRRETIRNGNFRVPSVIALNAVVPIGETEFVGLRARPFDAFELTAHLRQRSTCCRRSSVSRIVAIRVVLEDGHASRERPSKVTSNGSSWSFRTATLRTIVMENMGSF